MGEFYEFYELRGWDCSLVFFAEPKKAPSLIYWGERLSSLAEIKGLVEEKNPVLFGGLDESLLLNLFPENTKGWINRPPLKVHNDFYNSTASDFTLTKVQKKKNPTSEQITFLLQDRQVTVGLNFILFENGLLTINSEFTHELAEPLKVEYFSNPLVPVPSHHSKIKYWSGKWCGEFTAQSTSWNTGMFSLENRTGRTSHEFFPGLITHPRTTDENGGEALSAHLGWSGNWFLHLEQTAMNEKLIHSGVCYLPNEKQLKPLETLTSPSLFLAKSFRGFSDLSQKHHQFVRENFLKKSPKTRKIHFNTWEAIYFQHDLTKIKQLINLAQQIGVERFVIDDGWFQGRNDESSSLGDWEIDSLKYPHGFDEVVGLIEEAGMDFGLWVEPEMINAKSELFQKHPNWFLGNEKSLTVRKQFILNLALKEVQDYLFKTLDHLLRRYPIRYLKWDMNRYYLDFTQESSWTKPVAEKQTLALYALLAKLKKEHPEVEIQSCSSGGGRIDYGILKYVNRFWLSDHNDMHDRIKMHSEASHFFPPEVFGSHVHPSPSHTSGRKLNYEFIGLAAAFGGHFGLEIDLTKLSPAELKILATSGRLYKEYRNFLQEAKFYRLENRSPSHLIHLYVKGREFVLVVFQLNSLPFKIAPSISLAGLKPNHYYRINLLAGPSVYASAVREQETNLTTSGLRLSGRVLANQGFKLPSGWPDQAWVYLGVSEGEAGEAA